MYDIYGHEVATIVKDVLMSFGKHIEEFNPREYGLSPGIYYFSLTSNEVALKRKMVVN